MGRRFWLYSGASIIVIGLLSFLFISRSDQARAINVLVSAATETQQSDFQRYLADQTDEHKLISLAKQLATSHSDLVPAVIDRAYAINPNNRDVAVLAAQIHPELKERVKYLDPLYGE